MSVQRIEHRTGWRWVVPSLAGLSMVCALERTASAELGVKKVTIGFNQDAGQIYTPYVLASDDSLRTTVGNDCRSWRMVLPGLTYALDIALSGMTVCMIWGVGTGELYCWEMWNGSTYWDVYPEPNGVTFTKLAADGGGHLYAVGSNGYIYRFNLSDSWEDPGWVPYVATQAIEVATNLYDSEGVYFLAPPTRYGGYTAMSVSSAGGPVTTYGSPVGYKIAVDNAHNPWAANSGSAGTSHLFKWNGSKWVFGWSSGKVYEMDINQQSGSLYITSEPAVGAGRTLWSHDLLTGGWTRCAVNE